MSALLRRASWRAGAPVRLVLISLIRLYRLTVGQLLGGQCRFYPSCSFYAEGAIREVGWVRGVTLAIWRIARCNPFSAGGVDYPPSAKRPAEQLYDSVFRKKYDSVVHAPLDAGAAGALDRVESFGPQLATTRETGP